MTHFIDFKKTLCVSLGHWGCLVTNGEEGRVGGPMTKRGKYFLSHQGTVYKILPTALQSGLIQASRIKFTNGHAHFYRKNKVDTTTFILNNQTDKTDQMHFALYLYSGTRSHHWSPLYQHPAGSPESKQTIAHTELSQTSNSVLCKQLLSSLSGAQPEPFEECFRAKRKYHGTSNNTEGTAAVDPALSRLQSV